jgi:hypothetical protein
MRSLTPRLTGAGARSAEGTNTGHKNAEGMASVGVRVEPTVRLPREGTTLNSQKTQIPRPEMDAFDVHEIYSCRLDISKV